MEETRTWEDAKREDEERLERMNRLHELARSVGPENSIFCYHVVFKTWQDALDFQDFCEEQGFEVYFTEPADKHVTWMDDYYHVYPKK